MTKTEQGYRELSERVKRVKSLKRVYSELTQERYFNTSKGAKRRIALRKSNDKKKKDSKENDDKSEKFIYKWKRQRSR